MTTQPRIALVTGANRGIGFEICRQLVAQGLHVILTSRNAEQGQHAWQQLQSTQPHSSYYQLDISDPHSVRQVLAQVQHEFGRLDVLVNNAGVYLDEGLSLFAIDDQTMHTSLDVNFYGAFYACRAFVPLMQQQNYGRVVNVSSGYGAMSEMRARTAAYKISKVALNALTRIIADEVHAYNIKVNAMCPGWVHTDMGGPAAPRSPAQGADTAVWLAMLADNGPTGGFFRDRQPIEW